MPTAIEQKSNLSELTACLDELNKVTASLTSLVDSCKEPENVDAAQMEEQARQSAAAISQIMTEFAKGVDAQVSRAAQKIIQATSTVSVLRNRIHDLEDLILTHDLPEYGSKSRLSKESQPPCVDAESLVKASLKVPAAAAPRRAPVTLSDALKGLSLAPLNLNALEECGTSLPRHIAPRNPLVARRAVTAASELQRVSQSSPTPASPKRTASWLLSENAVPSPSASIHASPLKRTSHGAPGSPSSPVASVKPSLPVQDKAQNAKAKALFDYTAGESDEMSLTQGETIEVVNIDAGAGWTHARAAGGVREGLVPRGFIQLLE